MTPEQADAEADRMLKLLDVGLEALKNGDGDITLMALQQTLKIAQQLPQKVICLPDRSKEAPI